MYSHAANNQVVVAFLTWTRVSVIPLNTLVLPNLLPRLTMMMNEVTANVTQVM